MYRIRPYTAADHTTWNDFIHRSRNGVFLFQREYMDYHADRFEDASVIIESAQGTPRIVAVLPANRRHTPDGDHCITHGGLTFGGLVMDEKLGSAQVLTVMEQLAAWLAGRSFVQLHYKATPHLYHRLPSEDDLYALHRLGAHTTQVLLSSTLDLQRQAPTSSQKNHALNLARRAGIDVGRCRWADYWPLLSQTLKSRHGVGPVHTLAEIERLAGAFTQLEVLGAWQRPSHLPLEVMTRMPQRMPRRSPSSRNPAPCTPGSSSFTTRVSPIRNTWLLPPRDSRHAPSMPSWNWPSKPHGPGASAGSVSVPPPPTGAPS